MYSFSDPRFYSATSFSSSDKSPPVLSPSGAFSPFHPLLQYSAAAAAALSPYNTSTASQFQSNHLPFFHPHQHHQTLANLHSSRYHTPSPKLSSPSLSPTQSQVSPSSTAKDCTPESRSVRSPIIKHTNREERIKLFPSNKRKDYEAREGKNLSTSCQEKIDQSQCNESTDNLSCPICSETGFSSESLNDHFYYELKKFRSNTCIGRGEESEKVEHSPVARGRGDECVVRGSVGIQQQQPQHNASWRNVSSCSTSLSSSPPSGVSSIQERWEKFRCIRRNRCRRQRQQALIGRYTWNSPPPPPPPPPPPAGGEMNIHHQATGDQRWTDFALLPRVAPSLSSLHLPPSSLPPSTVPYSLSHYLPHEDVKSSASHTDEQENVNKRLRVSPVPSNSSLSSRSSVCNSVHVESSSSSSSSFSPEK